MPLYFHFSYVNPRHPEEDKYFNHMLLSLQCSFVLSNGQRCKRKCVIGVPCCNSHLPIMYHLQIKQSTIPNAGKGLFVYDKTKNNNEIVFKGNRKVNNKDKKGDIICPYDGEIINKHELEERYGKQTAPYGIRISKDRYEDAAIRRGVGSLVNHQRPSNCEFIISNGVIKLRAINNLRNGDELFINYGNEYHFDEHGVKAYTDNKKYNYNMFI